MAVLTRVVPQVLRTESVFRRLFLSQVLSVIGDRVTMVALPFAVLAIGGGVAQVAYVSAAQFLPYVVLALPAGVWADRWNRRLILIASDLARLVVQVVLASLLLTGSASLGSLLVLAAFYGAGDAFFSPAFTGLLPTTVSVDNLQSANALRGLTFSLGSIVGPVVAGVLIAFAGGPGGAMAFDAATFLVSFALLLRVRPVRSPSLPPPSHEAFVASLRSGWGEVRSRPWVVAMLSGLSAYHVIVLPAIFVIGPVLADDELSGARSWAAITALFGLGCIVGDLVFLRWRPRFALRVGSLMLIGASCQAAIIGSGLGTVGIALLELLAGICVTGAFTLWETSLGEHIPVASLSRVSSYDYLSTAGVIPLGNLLTGLASAAFGLHHTLLAMSVLGVGVSALVAATPSVRSLPRGVLAAG